MDSDDEEDEEDAEEKTGRGKKKQKMVSVFSTKKSNATIYIVI
jgi:hypothetical protein